MTKIEGSGSTGRDKREIVAMKKQVQTNLVHQVRFGKGQDLSNKARQPLPQGLVPAFDVRCLPGVFAARRALLIRNDLLISFPEIRITVRGLVTRRDRRPQLLTGLCTPVADDEGHDLASRPTQRNPAPALVGAAADE